MVIVIDNVPFHKSISIHENRILLLFHILHFEPYKKPIFFLNEATHSTSKTRNENQLCELLTNYATLISQVDCASYYKHMTGFIIKCLNNLPIVDELNFVCCSFKKNSNL